MKKEKAVVLLSGGLDSSTVLYMALPKYECTCLIFRYGQRHEREICSAKKIAKSAGCDYKVVNVSFPWKGSSLTDTSEKIPVHKPDEIGVNDIPSTYVPGRNTVFLSYALSLAEVIGAKKIFIGANAVDFSGYPDCRPEYYRSFNRLLRVGTKAGDIQIVTPLISMTKEDIVKTGIKYRVPFQFTWSCYTGGKSPCGKCDSCVLRARGFSNAGYIDPALSKKS
jgi:7-cyano-7-deazaguanine synthase